MIRLKCLAVDDEPGMRLGVVRALKNFTFLQPEFDEEVGFEMDQAETAEEALEKIDADPPDLVLLDLKLPGMNGLEALEEIEKKNLDLLVIMVTAYASIETAVTATKRGAFDFLAKPFTPKELKSTVIKATKHLMLSRQARRLAEEKREVRFQFISVLAHELKAPLGAVEGYLNILQSRSLGDNLDPYEEMIQRMLIRLGGMRKMIADLTDLTRLESGKKKREIKTVNVPEVARMAVETSLPPAQERGITIEIQAPEHIEMQGDQGEIEMILNNLVSNAVKYNREGGRVDVRLSEEDEGQRVRIEVEDTGIGMSEEEVEKLFSEFTRIRNKKTQNILGSGLGLSIVKKIASLYGGDAFVRSEPDVGTCFTVELDKTADKEVKENAEKGNPVLAQGNG